MDQELVKVRMMKMSVSDCITTYSTAYTCFYWLCRTNASAMCQCRERGDRRMRTFCLSDIGEIETETWVLRLGWWRVVDPCGSMVFASCKLPGWKSLKKSYLQQDLQTKLCEKLDKRVQMVSGAGCSRTASEWIEVARKRSWTPSGRVSGAVHISIWS